MDKVMDMLSKIGNGVNIMNTMNPFFDSMFKMPVNPVELGVLGKDIYLIDIDVPENKEHYPMKYGNLYKKVETGEINVVNGKIYVINNVEVKLEKISDDIFRVGGTSIGFKKNDYCELIHYEHVSIDKHCCLGNHCIIDAEGKIVFEADSPIKYPYYKKGCIVKYNDLYINLKTGKPIVSSYHQKIESENYLFVESSSYKNEFPKGVYKIEYSTGNFEIIN